jgi:hypothetical protein
MPSPFMARRGLWYEILKLTEKQKDKILTKGRIRQDNGICNR